MTLSMNQNKNRSQNETSAAAEAARISHFERAITADGAWLHATIYLSIEYCWYSVGIWLRSSFDDVAHGLPPQALEHQVRAGVSYQNDRLRAALDNYLQSRLHCTLLGIGFATAAPRHGQKSAEGRSRSAISHSNKGELRGRPVLFMPARKNRFCHAWRLSPETAGPLITARVKR
jgi:hypothetical protein